MELSPRLSLTYLAPAQAQKHVTVNDAFRRLDQLAQQSVLSRTTTAEPGSPADGDAYILGATHTGTDWATFSEHSIAAYQDGAWIEIVPLEGWRAWVADSDEFMIFHGSAWTPLLEGFGVTKLGINTTADTTNRLAVKSDAILFNHDDVTPGNDDCIVKVNKAAAGDTSSLIFQTNASGRAEFGLIGNDDFSIKVSPDNFSTSFNAIVIKKDTGSISFGDGAPIGDLHLFRAGAASFWMDNTANSVQMFFGAGSNGGQMGSVSNHYFRILTNNTERLRILNSGNVGIGEAAPGALLHVNGGGVLIGNPTGGDKGTGTLNAQAVYDDNTLLTCYVFDQAMDGAADTAKWDGRVPDRTIPEERDEETGEIIKPAETIARIHEPLRKFAARIGSEYDPLTLDGYAKHWKEKRHLTSMPNEAAFDPVDGQLTTGEWIQRVVETVEIQAVLIEALNARVKALEAGSLTRGPAQ